MLIVIGTINDYVVEVDNSSFRDMFLKNFIHERHKFQRGICHSEVEYYALEGPIFGTESCLRDILWFDTDLMIPCGKVYFREVLGPAQGIEQVVN